MKYEGYIVEFNVPTNGSDFCNTLEEAINLRDIISGGGIIYKGALEKHGLNYFPVREYMMRKSDGTPL